MNEFQAAMGHNLENVTSNIDVERIYKFYKAHLATVGEIFSKLVASKYNYSYIPVLFKNFEKRERVWKRLAQNGIFA
jgi:hypothetical protein